MTESPFWPKKREEIDIGASNNFDSRLHLKSLFKKQSYKKEITVVIIDDVEKYRKKILDLLPEELKDYKINFEEFSSRNWIKLYLKTKNEVEKDVFYILDNNFYKYEEDTSPTSNMWLEIYNFLKRKKPYILEKIAIFSSSDEDEIKEKFGNDIMIIPWKWTGISSSVHIWTIWNWIKEKMGEEK